MINAFVYSRIPQNNTWSYYYYHLF